MSFLPAGILPCGKEVQTKTELAGALVATTAFLGLSAWLGAPSGTSAIAGVIAAAAPSILQNIGSNWASGLIAGAWSRVCRPFDAQSAQPDVADDETGPATLDLDIQSATNRAFARAVENLHKAWWFYRGDHFRRSHSALAEAIDASFDSLVNSAGAPSAANPPSSLVPTELLQKPGTIRPNTLREELRLFLGIDETDDLGGLVDYLTHNLPTAFASEFGQELKQNDRAWRAVQSQLASESTIGDRELLRAQDRSATTQRQLESALTQLAAELSRWDERLRDPTWNRGDQGQVPIEQALETLVHASNRRLEASLDRWGREILDDIDRLRAEQRGGFSGVFDRLSGLENLLRSIPGYTAVFGEDTAKAAAAERRQRELLIRRVRLQWISGYLRESPPHVEVEKFANVVDWRVMITRRTADLRAR